MDLLLKTVTKIIVYVIGLITATLILLRGIIGPLWGSSSDLGLLGAIIAGVIGIVVLIWLAGKAFQNVVSDFRPNNFYKISGDVMKEGGKDQ